MGEDGDFPDAKIYKVEAIHVTTTRNRRKFTQAELEAAGRSLSFRPLNINHDANRQLPFPENATMFMEFDEANMAVVGQFRVQDPAIIAMIETDRINQVSIEQIPTKGERCDEIICEQHGVAFIGMALLESDIVPGDNRANIKKESYTFTISDLVVSNAQRTCLECTDFEACHTCKHKVEAGDDCMSGHMKEIKSAHPDMDRDQVIAIALSKCGMTESVESTWWWYNRFERGSQQHTGSFQDAQGIPDTAADDLKRDQLVGVKKKKKKREVTNGQRTPTPDNSYTTGTI